MSLTLDRKPLGQILLGRGIIEAAQLDRALDEQRRSNHRKLLGEILVEMRQVSEEQVAEVLAESYGLPFVRVSPRVADPKVIAAVPRAFLEKHQALPLFLVQGILTVAVAEPADLFLREELERVSGYPVQFVAATARDILATLQTYLPDDQVFIIDDVAQEVDEDAFTLLDADALPQAAAPPGAQDAPVEKLVNYCLYQAVRQGATDVYVEPLADGVRVRYRIDGRLVERMRPPSAMHEPLVARLKALASLDPSLRSVPQEGTIRARIDRKAVELAVSTAPVRGGESVTVRVDREERGVLRLEKLGFGYDMLKQFRRLLSLRNGLVLVAGPAGSGRSTALYSVLREMNTAELNVCTVEERIVATLEGARQLRFGADVGLDRAAAVRAMINQRPDVLMIDNLADAETARLAVEAALGGRLVFAGSAAPDAPSAVARLLHMGIEPYSVGPALAGVLSQRLVRRLCSACKESGAPTHADRKLIERWGGAPLDTLYRSRGCPTCNGLGYAGRIGLHELLIPDDALTERLSQGVTLADLRAAAATTGLRPCRLDGLEKVKSGLTTLDEVQRATGA
jgi:type IV pilus assembly protein PilB